MIEQLALAGNVPFLVALLVMLMLALLQVLGVGHLLGGDVDAGVDTDIGDGAGIDAGLLSLLGVGRLPFLMWLMLFLTIFGLLGLSFQTWMDALIGHPLTLWIAVPVTALAALPASGLVSRLLAGIVPRDETTAVPVESLVGREGEIVIGTAARGSPARACVVDVHGHTHHVMVEPDNEGQSFVQGERVLLVRLEGGLFKAIARGDRYLPQVG